MKHFLIKKTFLYNLNFYMIGSLRSLLSSFLTGMSKTRDHYPESATVIHLCLFSGVLEFPDSKTPGALLTNPMPC